jgi:hypothetical protein
MPVQLIPPGPGTPESVRTLLQSYYDAIRQLQQPGAPTRPGYVATKADLPTAADWPQAVVLCGEINSLVVSTLVADAYAWLRADGSAL